MKMKIPPMSEWEDPWFVHEIGKNESLDPGDHNFKGSFKRHLVVEKILNRLQWILICHDAVPGYTLLESFMCIGWGLNCSFPLQHIALYVVWYWNGCPRW